MPPPPMNSPLLKLFHVILPCSVLAYIIPLPLTFILHLIPSTTVNSKAPSPHLVFSLLTSLPTSTLNPHQFTCHKTARMAFKKWKSDHTTPSFKILPGSNEHKINSELLSTTYKALHNLVPAYISDHISCALSVTKFSHNGFPACFWNSQAQAHLRVYTCHFLHLEHSSPGIVMAGFLSFKPLLKCYPLREGFFHHPT